MCGTLLASLTATGLFTSFFCDSETSVVRTVYQTTRLTVTSVSSGPGSTVTVISTLTNTATLSSADTQFSSSTSPPPTNSKDQASETASETSTGQSHTAAIAGGVGGGVGGALAIAGIVGLLIHRKRKQLKEKVPEIAT